MFCYPIVNLNNRGKGVADSPYFKLLKDLVQRRQICKNKNHLHYFINVLESIRQTSSNVNTKNFRYT